MYEYVGPYGGGLVFTDREHRDIYDRDDHYEYLGKLPDFVRKVKKIVRRGKVYSTVYTG